jgi:DNA-binding response OmpR family regulator
MCVASSSGGLPKLEGKRVLVVEDEALVSMLVEDELRDAGATVLGPAARVDEAMRLVEAAAANGGMDAAVLDLNLQGEMSTPVAERLAALGVPFIFTTGYGDGRDTGGHGDVPVLEKPFDPERLVAVVEAIAAPVTRLPTPSGRAKRSPAGH